MCMLVVVSAFVFFQLLITESGPVAAQTLLVTMLMTYICSLQK